VGIKVAARLLGYAQAVVFLGLVNAQLCDLGRRMGSGTLLRRRRGVAEILAQRLATAIRGFLSPERRVPPFHEITPLEDAELVARVNASFSRHCG